MVPFVDATICWGLKMNDNEIVEKLEETCLAFYDISGKRTSIADGLTLVAIVAGFTPFIVDRGVGWFAPAFAVFLFVLRVSTFVIGTLAMRAKGKAEKVKRMLEE